MNRDSYQNRGSSAQQTWLPKERLPEKLTKEETVRLVNEEARKLGEQLATGKSSMTTSQLRKFFHELKATEEKIKAGVDEDALAISLGLFKAKVAYNVKRQGSKVPDEFKQLVDKAVTIINSSQNKTEAFQNFLDYMEAIIAYHKHSGGKDS